jgi:exopolysaccharide biosynthesis polyprenyl glycosylphosphotransferase
MAQTAPKIDFEPVVDRRPLQRRSAERIILRMVADGMAVSTSFFVASILRFEILPGAPAATVDYALVTAVTTPVLVAIFWMYGLYEPRQVLSPVTEFKQVFHGLVSATVLLFLSDSFFNLKLARGWILLAMVGGFVIVGGERLFVRKLLHYRRRRGGDITRTIILGANHEAVTVAHTIEREAWLGYRIVGFVDDVDSAPVELGQEPLVLGPTTELATLIEAYDVGLVLVSASAFDAAKLNRLFWQLQESDVDLQVTSGTIDLLASRMTVQSVAGVPLFYVRRTGMDKVQRTIKRTVDLLGSATAMVLLLPALAATALWIKRDSDGPVFFTQVRVGRDGQAFKLWKFRTMQRDAEDRRIELEHLSDGPGLLFKLKEDPRVTGAGRFLRRYSLDELPQLVNVLRGEMSLVGPRPALPSEVEQYDDWLRNRLKVKPGMTGLWQVSGRAQTSFSDYVRYDLFYIQNWSLSLDLWILWRTLRAVLSGEGAH